MTSRGRRFVGPTIAVFAVLLTGCASYHRLPLAERASLAPGIARLDTAIPAGAGPGRRIDVTKPLGVDELGLLAILNDPGLKAERGEIAQAQAGVTQAKILPNPSIGLGYEALLGGAATVGAWTASLSQSVGSLVTYHSRVASARAQVSQVNAELLWREWQVAQKARLLALDIYWEDESIRLNRQELTLVMGELRSVRAAMRAGNLGLTALAPLEAAEAAAEQSLSALGLARLKDWQSLDSLLGLAPVARPHD